VISTFWSIVLIVVQVNYAITPRPAMAFGGDEMKNGRKGRTQPFRKCLRIRNENPTAAATSKIPTRVLAISIGMILAYFAVRVFPVYIFSYYFRERARLDH
jgi:hypothetical protein